MRLKYHSQFCLLHLNDTLPEKRKAFYSFITFAPGYSISCLPMRILAILLLPFTFLYGLLTDLRNYLYDRGLLKSIRFEVFTINVGNLAVGGTGKTPHVAYLIRLLKQEFGVATLSRGYGRRTKGFLLAGEHASATSLGDEPMLFYRRFGPEVSVAVGEERALAIPQLLYEKPGTQVVLLDDAFQHRSVHPHLNLLLTDYHRLFTRDLPFPSGRLRERRPGARRADVVIVTKCPADLSGAERKRLTEEINRYASSATPVYFSGIRYGEPVPFFADQASRMEGELMLVSGIANPAPFEQYAREHFRVMEHCEFRDHHHYSEKDIRRMNQIGESAGLKETSQNRPTGQVCVLTTEKDYVKLLSLPLKVWAKGLVFFYLPIEISFLAHEGTKFDTQMLQSVRQFVSTEKESRALE
jgi:tetraacyldisaccharide 4'-kinase